MSPLRKNGVDPLTVGGHEVVSVNGRSVGQKLSESLTDDGHGFGRPDESGEEDGR